MPVGKVLPASKVGPYFAYPPSGRVRVYLEAEFPVDVYIANPQQAPQITSVQTAAAFAPAVLIYNSRLYMNEIINLPKAWESVGWSLVIGHPGVPNEAIAVCYFIYPA